jgi:hypothetical protein
MVLTNALFLRKRGQLQSLRRNLPFDQPFVSQPHRDGSLQNSQLCRNASHQQNDPDVT